VIDSPNSLTPGASDLHPLDHAVWLSLTGPLSAFAEGTAQALRFRPDVSPFGAFAPGAGAAGWTALFEVVKPGDSLAVFGTEGLPPEPLPEGWQQGPSGPGRQLVATEAFSSGPDAEAVPLGPDDVEEMLDLVARTKPGPFGSGTYLLGGYLGIRREGALVAMAGQRLHPPGYVEISAVCTDPAFQGQGLGTRLIRAVAHGIREAGEIPFLHAAAVNTHAIRLYEKLGFSLRRSVDFCGLANQAPPAFDHRT
jgi:ribosomal protein S18 acetylase RimI-like enzyme